MTKTIEKEKQRIRKVAHLLYEGAKRVRILRSIDWPASVKQGFFAKGAKELPEISYPGFDAKPTIDIIREARRMKPTLCALLPPPRWNLRKAFKTSSTSSPALTWVLRHPLIFPPRTLTRRSRRRWVCISGKMRPR